MLIPCLDHCYLKYGRQYTSECDERCTYAKALKECEKIKRERDAAVEELKNAYSCFACKKFRRNGGACNGGSVCFMRDFEWRGVQEGGAEE